MNWGAIKIIGGLLAGLTPLALGLHANMTNKIEVAETRSKEYVQLKLEPFQKEIDNLKKEVGETKEMVQDIHKHLLNKKKDD